MLPVFYGHASNVEVEFRFEHFLIQINQKTIKLFENLNEFKSSCYFSKVFVENVVNMWCFYHGKVFPFR